MNFFIADNIRNRKRMGERNLHEFSVRHEQIMPKNMMCVEYWNT